MKIYKRIVINLITGREVESDYFSYSGQIAENKGGGKIVQAPRSPQENALLQSQTDLLKQQSDIIQAQYKQQNLLAPFLFRQAGLEPKFDAQGGIIGFSEKVDPNAPLLKDIQTKFLERTKAGLEGRLPINSALTQQFDIQEKELKEGLRQQIGPGWETSTPGIQAINNFRMQKNALIDASSRGDISLSESLNLANQGQSQANVSNFLSRITGINQAPFATVGALGQTAAGFNAPLSLYERDRARQFQASMFRSQQSAGLFGSLFEGMGSLAGLLGSQLILRSSKEFKEQIEKLSQNEIDQILDDMINTPLYRWRYKGEKREHIGPITEESPGLIVDGKVLVGIDYLGALLACVKSLRRRIERLEIYA